MKQANLMFVFVLSLFLGACQTPQGRYDSVRESSFDEIDVQMEMALERARPADQSQTGRPPASVLEALVPGLSLSSETFEAVEERFDFVVQQPLNARQFFTLLTEGTEYSIVVHPGIEGTVSALDLKNVTLNEAINQVASLYGLRVNRTGNIYQIMPGGIETRIFNVNYLNVSRSGNSNMQITASGISQSNNNNWNNQNLNNQNWNNPNFGSPGGNFGNQNNRSVTRNSGGASINTSSEADYWEDLESIIMSIIDSSRSPLVPGFSSGGEDTRRSVIISPHTGMVVVRAFPDELDKVAEFLEASQGALHRQVVLEAKILEVDLKDEFQSGIDLSALRNINSGRGQIGVEFGFTGDSLGAIGNPLAVSYNTTSFDGVIRLLETQGTVQVVSSPRISTLNNQKAVFKVGDERYFLTAASSTAFGAGDQAISNQNVQLEPFFSGIALDVTPQISQDGDITLHIHPILSQVQEEIKVIRGESFPLAISTTRESDSIARARNGEVIVISGLMQTRTESQEAGIMGTRNIPLIGDMRQHQQATVKTELVILLRAIVDEGDVMRDLIQEHSDSFTNLRRQIGPLVGQ